MPGLNTQLMLLTARARFSSFHLRLPTVVGGGASHLHIASPPPAASRMTFVGQQPARGTAPPSSPALFLAASNDARDIEMQQVCNHTLDAYLGRICDAIGQAHAAWRLRATLVGVRINGITAVGGSLQGAGLEPDIRLHAPQDNAWQRPRSGAIAAGIGFCWENWQRTISVPGLPLYPGFAAFPGPVAPPTPNVPFPLIALMQNPVLLSSQQLRFQMLAHYSGDHEWHNELFDAVASGMERAFQVWAPSQMVMNVLGTGPVPTFAPPYVPVGPVVGGTAAQTPGAFSI